MLAFLLLAALAAAPGANASPAATASSAAAAASGGTELHHDEAELAALDDAFVAAFNAEDKEAILAYYADDAIRMDPGPALRIKGKAAIRDAFAAMFAGPERYELSLEERRYWVKGDVAWSATLWTTTRTDAAGAKIATRGRASAVFEKRAGKWLAVVDHASLPMPPAPPGEHD